MNKRSIFLVDGVGALVSSAFLGLVIPRLFHLVGMPLQVLYPLALLALLFATYSLLCFRFADHAEPLWLRLIAGANLSYCVLTLALVVVYYGQLTALGLAYFLAESVIVLGLVWLERKILRSLQPTPCNPGGAAEP